MKHLGSLESTQEARVALGYASSNSYASFVLSKLPACFISRWMHVSYEPIVNYIICRVIDGLETLDDLEKLPVNEKTYRPLTEVRIKNVTIHANPIADKSGWINPTGKLRCKPTTTYCLLPNKDSCVCYQTSNTGGNNFTIKQLKMQQKTILRDCVKRTFYFGTNFV